MLKDETEIYCVVEICTLQYHHQCVWIICLEYL